MEAMSPCAEIVPSLSQDWRLCRDILPGPGYQRKLSKNLPALKKKNSNSKSGKQTRYKTRRLKACQSSGFFYTGRVISNADLV
jgi:hypothetical protein